MGAIVRGGGRGCERVCVSTPLSGDLGTTLGSSSPALPGSLSDSIDIHQQPSTLVTSSAAPVTPHPPGAPPGDVRTGHILNGVLSSSVGTNSSPQPLDALIRLRGGGPTAQRSSQRSGRRLGSATGSSTVSSTPFSAVRSNPPRVAKTRGISSNLQHPSSPSSDADNSSAASSSSSEASAAEEIGRMPRLAGTSRTTSSTLVEQSTVSRRVDGSRANTSVVRASSQVSHRGGGDPSSEDDADIFSAGSSARASYRMVHPWSCGKCTANITQARSIAGHLRQCDPDIDLSVQTWLCQYVARCPNCQGIFGRGTALTNHSVTCTGASVQARLQPHRQRAAALSQENRQRTATRPQPR